MELQDLTSSINNIKNTFSNLENSKNKLDIEISLLTDLIKQNETELKFLEESIINYDEGSSFLA